MFASFFPNPRLFFPAAVLWTALSMTVWYGFARDLGPQLSLGGLVGLPHPPADASGEVMMVLDEKNTPDAAFLRLISDPTSTGSFLL